MFDFFRRRRDRDEPEHGLTRRQFMGASGSLLLGLGLVLSGAEALAVDGVDDPETPEPDLFVEIQSDGTVVLTCHRSEMGQHVWTAVAQLLAEDLDADWASIRIEQAPGHPRYGDQNTDGSRSIRNNFDRLRLAGAAMRQMLLAAAAERWDVKPAALRTEPGVVIHDGSGQRATYGELSAEAAELPVPSTASLTLKSPSEWRLLSKPVPSLTTPLIVRGAGVFGQDVRVEGMRYAVIARPPQVLGKVASVDDAAALAMPGVESVVKMPELTAPVGFKPLGGIAVVAGDTWAAIRGRAALDITWEAGPNADYDSPAFAEALMATANEPGEVRRERGNVDEALEGAATRVSADYYVPHLAHSAMEPPAVFAEWTDDGKVRCLGCVQAPQAARTIVAQVCGVPEDDVTIEVTWLGGGFGRKSKPDHFAEAAWVAREAGVPVKVVWTREDDLQHAYYHTVSAQHFEGGLDAEGSCVAWLHRTVFPPIRSTFVAGADRPGDGDLRQGASDTPFAVANLRLESGNAEAHVRTGWLRSVANIYHAFGVQSFVAELAHAAGRDPRDYLLELIGPPREIDLKPDGVDYDNYGSPLELYPLDTGRLRHVIDVVSKMAGWGRAMEPGRGLGIAAHRSFVSYVATVVEVAVDPEGRLTIPGVWSAIDAGTVVNTNSVLSQLEGGTLFGLSNALYGAITATNGAIDQANFPDWRVMRMNEAPRHMEAHLVESEAPPGGVGEPPTPPAAPALANAIFAATGFRVRTLPIFGPSRRDRLPVFQRPQESP